MTPELLTADEAAELLRVSGTTMRRWARLNLVRSIRLPSGQIRIPRSEVERLLRDGLGVSVPVSPARHRVQPAAGARQARPKAVAAPGRTEQLQPLAAAIIARADRVLMTRRRFGKHGEGWSWPSGRPEADESLEAALVRELAEELQLSGAEVRAWVGDIDLPSGYRMSHFAVDIPAGAEPVLVDHEELAEACWMTIEEAEAALSALPAPIRERALRYARQVLSPGKLHGRRPDNYAVTADGRPLLVAAIIPHPEGRPQVLMTERAWGDPIWSWPAGHVWKGETPERAVIRELTEELSVQHPEPRRQLGVTDTAADISRWWGRRFRHGYRMIHIEVAIASPEVEVIDHDELRRVEWRSSNEVERSVAALPPELAAAAMDVVRQVLASSRPR
jgi:8-oxo-dGTP diphosphatase